ncbi:MAG: cytochrome c biogenesis protein CcdA [Candidatus Bathyarchaeia archaeon]
MVKSDRSVHGACGMFYKIHDKVFGKSAVERTISMLCVAVISLYIVAGIAWCAQQVRIEFLYYDKFCSYCPGLVEDYIAYIHNSEVLEKIKSDYGEKVAVEYIFFFSDEGLKRVKQYGLGLNDWNTVIVNGKIIFGGGRRCVNETMLREIIDSQLADSNNLEENSNLEKYTEVGIMVTAFVLGFFESFSPCVLIMLSFIVGYTSGGNECSQVKEGFLKVMVFGVSFVLASIILSCVCNLVFSISALHLYLTLIACLLAILFGFNLLGILRFSEHSKFLIRRIAKRYAFNYTKIFLLGLMFYFLDPCVAPMFASLTTAFFSNVFSFALFFFCVGAFVPFVGVGLLAGSISKIVRGTYRHRIILKVISGVILIGYASYILFRIVTTL